MRSQIIGKQKMRNTSNLPIKMMSWVQSGLRTFLIVGKICAIVRIWCGKRSAHLSNCPDATLFPPRIICHGASSFSLKLLGNVMLLKDRCLSDMS